MIYLIFFNCDRRSEAAQQQAQAEGLTLRTSKAGPVKRHHLESRDLPGGRRG